MHGDMPKRPRRGRLGPGGNHDVKLMLMRRATTKAESCSTYGIGGRELAEHNRRKPVTLPRLKFLEEGE